MRILIVGAGRTGRHLATQFIQEHHDLVAVDPDADALETLASNLDVQTVHGDGADPSVLDEAGVAKADLVVAVAENDRTNLLACIFAHARGVPKTVARVSRRAYSEATSVDFASLGISLLVNQYDEYASDLYNVIRLPGAIEVADLFDERAMLVGLPVHPDSPLLGSSLRDFPKKEWLDRIRFIAVRRGAETSAPRGDTRFAAGDEVYFAGLSEDIAGFLKWAWPMQERFRRIVVAGGGELGLRLARRLERSRMQVFLVESDPARAKVCAEALSRANVIAGDALDSETVRSVAGGGDLAYVATTGSDEHNIIGCLVAQRSGAKFTAARIASRDYIHIVETHKLLDRVIDPRMAMTNAILHFVRGRNVAAASILTRLPGELLEVRLAAAHPWAGKAVKNLDVPKHATLVAVARGEKEVFVATGETVLAAGDILAVYALPEALDDVDRILQTQADG
jgi:trk system potassium uptake protein TrkA